MQGPRFMLHAWAMSSSGGEHEQLRYRHLAALTSPALSYLLPLLCICHVDMNAYFAQVEQLRLGLPASTPIVCVQWGSVIAVLYAARPYGILRIDSLLLARAKCPHLVAAHTAVYRRGELHWQYVEGMPSATTHKVLLDPYRRESRKIMRVFKKWCLEVEKASVDEAYLDLGPLVYRRVVELWPELARGLPDDELPEVLEMVQGRHLGVFEGVVIGDEGAHGSGSVVEPEAGDGSARGTDAAAEPDVRANSVPTSWPALVHLVASQIALAIRQDIHQSLGYTTSAGIASTKLVAKLALLWRKPDCQTVVLPEACAGFVDQHQLLDIGLLGGKVGQTVAQYLGLPRQHVCRYVVDHYATVGELEEALDGIRDDDKITPGGESIHDFASRFFHVVRGTRRSPLKSRVLVLLMLLNKNFRAAVASPAELALWMRVFAADVGNRVVELEEELRDRNNKRTQWYRPLRVSIYFKGENGVLVTRQATMPVVGDVERLPAMVYAKAMGLVYGLRDEKVWPCQLFGLGVSGWGDAPERTIDTWVRPGAALPLLAPPLPPAAPPLPPTAPPRKRPKRDILAQLTREPPPPGAWYCAECRSHITTPTAEHQDFHLALAVEAEWRT